MYCWSTAKLCNLDYNEAFYSPSQPLVTIASAMDVCKRSKFVKQNRTWSGKLDMDLARVVSNLAAIENNRWSKICWGRIKCPYTAEFEFDCFCHFEYHLLFWAVLGIKPRASSTLRKNHTTRANSQLNINTCIPCKLIYLLWADHSELAIGKLPVVLGPC